VWLVRWCVRSCERARGLREIPTNKRSDVNGIERSRNLSVNGDFVNAAGLRRMTIDKTTIQANRPTWSTIEYWLFL
jgi:hypothetical protein